MDTAFSCAKTTTTTTKQHFPLDDRDKANPLQGMQFKWTQPLAVQNTTSLWTSEARPTLNYIFS